jgi:hypothetical protein
VAGFDAFLLGQAVKEGARIFDGQVEAIAYAASGMPRLTVRTPPGERALLDAAFVASAIGINAHCGHDYRDDALIASVQRLNPAFVPGKSRKAFIFELDVGQEYLERNLHREIYFIEYGSKQLAIEHTALVPKGRFLTVAMIGKCIDRAALPRDTQRIVRDFLTLPQIGRILPGIQEAPLACACAPRMAVTPARSPFGDRFAIIGDAVGARLNKDGLFSAHVTASRLAFTKPVVSRITYQAYATECKVRDERSRPLSAVLGKISSGTAAYREVLREMCGYGVLRSFLAGASVKVESRFA